MGKREEMPVGVLGAAPVAGGATPMAGVAAPVAGGATPMAGVAAPVAGGATPMAGVAAPVAGDAAHVPRATASVPETLFCKLNPPPPLLLVTQSRDPHTKGSPFSSPNLHVHKTDQPTIPSLHLSLLFVSFLHPILSRSSLSSRASPILAISILVTSL
ncbi:unnamed protein product [Closterium sp. NIES-65]|nr:unnamed protein product [Closterium sp. NIES-65]